MKNLALLAVAIGFLLRLAKDPDLAARLGLPSIPKKYVALAALLLGACAGLVEALSQGKTLVEALPLALEGVLSGTAAVAGHQVLVEGLRGGKELGK